MDTGVSKKTWALVVLLVMAVIASPFVVQYVQLHYFEPQQINVHAQNVRHSVDYVMAQNQQAEQVITDWNSAYSQYQHDKANNEPQSVLDGDLAHLNSDRNQIQVLANNLDPSEVAPIVQQFLYANPGPIQP